MAGSILSPQDIALYLGDWSQVKAWLGGAPVSAYCSFAHIEGLNPFKVNQAVILHREWQQ